MLKVPVYDLSIRIKQALHHKPEQTRRLDQLAIEVGDKRVGRDNVAEGQFKGGQART